MDDKKKEKRKIEFFCKEGFWAADIMLHKPDTPLSRRCSLSIAISCKTYWKRRRAPLADWAMAVVVDFVLKGYIEDDRQIEHLQIKKGMGAVPGFSVCLEEL